MNISQIIRDLLLRNELVVIPGLGSMKIIHHPARLSRTTQTLMPPSEEIVLDTTMRPDDNQLLLTIRKRLSLSEAESNEALKQFIHKLDTEIQSAGITSLEGLGKIKKNAEGKLIFEADADLLNPGGVYALPKIEIPTVPSREETPRKVAVEKAALPLPEVRKRRRWWIPAAIIIILAAVGSLAYFSGFLEDFIKTLPQKETVVKKAKNQDKIVFGNRDTSLHDTMRAAISQELDRQTEHTNALRPEEPVSVPAGNNIPQTAVTVPSKPFQIISGSFTLAENADRQIRKFKRKGVEAVLLPKTGKYFMVSVGSYSTLDEATADLEKLIDQLGMDLWVAKIVY